MMGESRQRRSESHYEVYVRHKYLYLCYAELMHGVEKSMAVEKIVWHCPCSFRQ